MKRKSFILGSLFLMEKAMIMVGNMQRKIVAVMVFGLMMPFYMQAMDIMPVIPENVDKGIAVALAVTGIGVAAALSSNAQEHIVRSLAFGLAVGTGTYGFLRKHTKEQIKKNKNQTVWEIRHSNLRNFVVTKNGHIPVISSKSITGAYTGFNFFEEASQDIRKFKVRLLYDLGQVEKAGLEEDAKELQDIYDILEAISKELLECKDAMSDSLNIQKQIIENMELQANIQNDTKKVDLKEQEVRMKWWETYRLTAQWGKRLLISAPFFMFIFAWQLKLLPFPSFAR